MNDPSNKYFRYLLFFMIFAVLGWYFSKQKDWVRHQKNVAKNDEIKAAKEKQHESKTVHTNKKLPNSPDKGNVPQDNLALKKNKLSRDRRSIRQLANRKSSKVVAKTFATKYLEYFEESSFSLGSQQLRISSSLVAYPKESVGSRVPLYQVGNYLVFEEAIDDPLTKHEQIRVVYNSSTKRYAVLTGLIFIRFEEEPSNETIEEKYHLKVEERIEHLGMIVTRPKEGVSLVEVVELLKASDGVETFEVELIEGGLHAK